MPLVYPKGGYVCMLFPKPKKKKQKSRHTINTPVTQFDNCYLCGQPATEKHEWFNGADRTFSIENGAQVNVCRRCHNWLHEDKVRWMKYQRSHQMRIMIEKGWTKDQWRRNGVPNGPIVRRSWV